MARDEASEVSRDWLAKTDIVPNDKLRNIRFYYSGNDWETPTCLRRSMTGPNLCFRMIEEGLTLKAETPISRLYYGPGQKWRPERGQWPQGPTGDLEKWTEERDF